jgi:hypothetical protein
MMKTTSECPQMNRQVTGSQAPPGTIVALNPSTALNTSLEPAISWKVSLRGSKRFLGVGLVVQMWEIQRSKGLMRFRILVSG